MTFESFESIFTLFCTIVGLLGCLFKYIEVPKRTYLFLVIYFLAHFLSDYYWTIYVLVLDSCPTVSSFAANLGWNVGYVFLFLAVYNLRKEHGNRRFYPLMLWPVLTNIPQLILYIQFGAIFNNIWQVSITTLVMIFCTGELLYYAHNIKNGAHFPYLAALILLYECFTYGMWTASCFDWDNSVNPYFYCEILAAIVTVFFVWGMNRDQESESQIKIEKNTTKLRFQATVQAILSFVIITLCMGGYFVATLSRDSLQDKITLMLFLISVAVVCIILFLLHKLAVLQRSGEKKQHENVILNRNRFNLIFTIVFTFVLMMFAVILNTRSYYNVSVTGVFEDGENKVKMTATHLENYLTVAEATLRVAADNVERLVQNRASSEEILTSLTNQTKMQPKEFDEYSTGIYAYVNGIYMDGTGWIPPDDYVPESRTWYKAALDAAGKIVIVSPYVDAQTGSVVITLAKSIPSSEGFHSMVCLDVAINYIRNVTEKTDIAGRGWSMVVNTDGFIIAHRNEFFNGKNISDIYGSEFLDKMSAVNDGKFNEIIDDEKCTVFVCPIMNQWFELIVVSNAELFENVYSQLLTNIMVSLLVFFLISFFYYLGYKNEQLYGKEVEEMNVQVVSALAAAIDAKDTYTNGHSARVAVYSKMIAERAGCSKSKQDEIYMMALLHDVGKIGIPDEVINKPSGLTDEEYELIKKHPVIGNEILSRIKDRKNLAIGAKWHHERFGGGGYPDGLCGEQIPEEARIIAVADSYDTMASRRNYRDVMPQKQVRAEIEKGIGTQFDPKYANIMIQLIDEDTDYSMREI